jgi:hypothetical protein
MGEPSVAIGQLCTGCGIARPESSWIASERSKGDGEQHEPYSVRVHHKHGQVATADFEKGSDVDGRIKVLHVLNLEMFSSTLQGLMREADDIPPNTHP